MRLSNIYSLVALFSTARGALMPTKKICKDCRHFIGDNIECRKFGDTNIITGKVTYKSARSVRDDEKKCGENAIYFEENNFKIVTVPYYFVKENLAIILPGLITGVYLVSIFTLLHK